MSFKSVQVNRATWRVLDEERGIELKSLSGSKDGVLTFMLESGVDERTFSGRLIFRKKKVRTLGIRRGKQPCVGDCM